MKNLVKITLSLVAFLCLSQVVSAQAVNQGAWMLGGTAGFESISPKVDGAESQTTINVSPNLGYFIADDLAIGLALNLQSVTNAGFVEGADFTDFGVGPFVRFYFADAIFAQAGLFLGLGDNEFTDIELGIGYSWFVDNSVAIEPKLFYRLHGVDLPDDAGDFSTFGLSIGIQAFVDRVGVE